MTDDNNKDKKRENPSSQEGPSAEVTSAAGATTNVGDKDKKGTTKPEDVISYTTGISGENRKVLNPNTEAGVTKELDRDIVTTTDNTEDVSKLVSSGTSSAKSCGIDKDDIYSSDDSTRHLEKVQQTTTDKEATNTVLNCYQSCLMRTALFFLKTNSMAL
jgi:hypothetical protein